MHKDVLMFWSIPDWFREDEHHFCVLSVSFVRCVGVFEHYLTFNILCENHFACCALLCYLISLQYLYSSFNFIMTEIHFLNMEGNFDYELASAMAPALINATYGPDAPQATQVSVLSNRATGEPVHRGPVLGHLSICQSLRRPPSCCLSDMRSTLLIWIDWTKTGFSLSWL